MSPMPRLIALLIRAYPAAWRREYGAELGDLLARCPLTITIAANVVWNGLRLRARPPREGVAMPAPAYTPAAFLRFAWSCRWWTVGGASLAAGLAFGVASWLPKEYRSEATVVVTSPKIVDGIVEVLPFSLSERLPALTHQVLSQVRLERLSADLNLTPAGTDKAAIDDVVDALRRSIDVTVIRPDTLRVACTWPTAERASAIAWRITSLVIDESNRDRELLIEGTSVFLSAQIEELAERLTAAEARLARAQAQHATNLTVVSIEHEMLRTQYRTLLAKREAAGLAVNLERRQIGRQFKVLEVPRVPTAPVSPDRLRLTLLGGLAGAVAGVLLILLAYMRRLSRDGLSADALEQPAAS